MKQKRDNWDSIAVLMIALAMTSYGVWMVMNKRVARGINYLTQQRTGSGGELLILVGIILLIVTYLSLPPFSKIRQFFEKKRVRKKKKFKEKNSK